MADYIKKIRTETGDKQIDYTALANLPVLYPVGSIFVTSDKDYKPGSKLGGTWKLVDKHLKGSYYSEENFSDLITFTDSNCNAVSMMINVHDHEIHLTLSFVLKNEITATNPNKDKIETNFVLGTIDFSKMGFNRLSCTCYSTMATDVSNAICLTSLGYETGAISCVDIYLQGGITSIEAGNTIRCDFLGKISPDHMIDSFCDKFFWQRTA